MKVCSKCRIEKDLESFGNNRTKKDGKNCYFIECAIIVRTKSNIKRRNHRIKYQYLQRLLDPKRVATVSKKWYLKHRDEHIKRQK
mgnify:FL=1